MVSAFAGSQVELYFNNEKKLDNILSRFSSINKKLSEEVPQETSELIKLKAFSLFYYTFISGNEGDFILSP